MPRELSKASRQRASTLRKTVAFITQGVDSRSGFEEEDSSSDGNNIRSVPATLPALNAWPRTKVVLACGLAIRNQMGWLRSLVCMEHGKCKPISRNGNEFKSFSSLNEATATELRSHDAILDGEIVCLDADGKPQFRDLLFRGESRALLPLICSG